MSPVRSTEQARSPLRPRYLLPAGQDSCHSPRVARTASFGPAALGRKSLALAEVMWQAPLVAGDVVWWPAGPGASRGSVAALTVSYNTRELTAFLL